MKKSSTLFRELAYEALCVLSNNGGPMWLHDMLDEVEKRKEGEIPNELKALENGVIIWRNRSQLASIMFVSAGYLKKDKGTWSLTELGKEALANFSKDDLIKKATGDYNNQQKKKKQAQKESLTDLSDAEMQGEDLEYDGGSILENYQNLAQRNIRAHIHSLGPYRFQDLCAALLEAMGYYIRSNSSPGKDGGIDILAYTDFLGSKSPRLKVQVKHQKENNVSVDIVRELRGSLKEGDIGILISSSDFTSDCRVEARGGSMHVELIDIKRFIELWKEHYENLSEQNKSLLPLEPVYFLDTKRLKRD